VLRNQDFPSEIRLWQADIQRAPQNYAAWLALAESLTGEGRYGEAESAFRRALDIAPGSAVSLRAWAIFLLKTQRPAEAFAAAQRATELQLAGNDTRRAQGNMGLLAEAAVELGEFAQALSWLERGARFDDEVVKRPAVLGRALAGVGRCDEAVVEFEKIPGWMMDRSVALAFGGCLYKAGRYAEAGELLERFLSEPDSAPLWNLLGAVRASQGRVEEAIIAFRRAVALKPDNRYYRENLDRVLLPGASSPRRQ
jgi:tetratricopeptide (TPR) repeat protein